VVFFDYLFWAAICGRGLTWPLLFSLPLVQIALGISPLAFPS